MNKRMRFSLAALFCASFIHAQTMFDYGKGDVFLKGSLPYVNSFQLDFGNFKKSNTGFFGMAGGMEVFINQQRYLEFSAGLMGDIFAPIGPIDYDEGEHERLISAFSKATFNHTNGIFSFGYGLNASLNIWRKSYEGIPPPGYLEEDEKMGGFGPVLTGYYHLGPCYAGIQYHAFLNDGGGWLYGHVISLDFGLHLRIRKKA